MRRPHLLLVALAALIVPRRLRADWRREWEAELQNRERTLAEWQRLDRRHRLDLIRRSTSAFADALWLQPRRLEDHMVQDLRFALRMLLKHPGFAVMAVTTLALGIGANTAIFTLLDKVLLRPLPVERPTELVTFLEGPTAEVNVFSYPSFANLRDHNTVLAGLAAYFQMPMSLSDPRRTERVVGQIVSGNYFDVVGVRPALGRFFLPEEDRTPGTHPVVVIGHGLWRRWFDRAPSAIGATINLNGFPHVIVGIAPREFTGTTRATATDVYVPMMMHERAFPGSEGALQAEHRGWLTLIGRLKPNVARPQAQAAISALIDGTPPPAPGDKSGDAANQRLLLAEGCGGYADRIADLSLPLKLLMAVVGCVLAIACANVANLLLVRAIGRRREIAVRLANGASRARIVRQLITEGALLAAIGGGTGLLVAQWSTRLLLGFQERLAFVPRAIDGAIDGRVLAFTAIVSAVTGLAFAVVPARQACNTDLSAALKREPPSLPGARHLSVRNLLIATQVALSVVVLIGAGLCVRSLRALQAIDAGLEPAKVATASFDLDLNGYDEVRGRRFITSATDRLSAVGGVETVSAANIVAFSEVMWISGITIEGYEARPGERMPVDVNVVGAGYFRTVGTPIVSGREFTAQDAEGAPRVLLVNEAMARRYFRGQDPVGRRTSRGVIIGVVRDSKEKGLVQDARPAIYWPLAQHYVPNLTLLVRTAEPRAVLPAVGRELHALDPALPIYNLQTLADQRDGSIYNERLSATLLTLFGTLAALLAAVGLYAVLSYSVTERTHEIGIRVALGAQRRDVIAQVVSHGLAPTLIGLVVGVASAYAATRAMARLLFGVSPTDPLTFVVVPGLLIVVALIAAWLPAHRATRLDPLAALRHE